MSGFQWRKSLCSLHLKRKNYSVFDWLTDKIYRNPKLQLFRKKTRWGPRIEQTFLRESLWWSLSLISYASFMRVLGGEIEFHRSNYSPHQPHNHRLTSIFETNGKLGLGLVSGGYQTALTDLTNLDPHVGNRWQFLVCAEVVEGWEIPSYSGLAGDSCWTPGSKKAWISCLCHTGTHGSGTCSIAQHRLSIHSLKRNKRIFSFLISVTYYLSIVFIYICRTS